MSSASLWERARRLMPGGVSSPVRAFRAVRGDPFFAVRGEGPWLEDADGRRYLDYVLSWGPLILGHAHPEVVAAVRSAAGRGLSFGTPTPGEVELAEAVCRLVPSVERVRFVSSGTEATMSAVRLARAATGRDGIVKFEGCYHGHADPFLVQAGSGVATLGLPDSPGVPAAASALTLALPYNDLDALETALERRGGEVAAVILEPVIGNAGFIPPLPGFLEGVRRLTERTGSLLIFDEVMTGFRVAPGGAQELFGVRPDLTVLGKVLGGGLPVAAYGGPARLMERVAPSGPVYQAGTLSGNPLGMAAGAAQLAVLERDRPWEGLETRTGRLVRGILAAAERAGIPAAGGHLGSMWGVFLGPERPPRDYRQAKAADAALYGRYFHACLERGVFFAPSAFEAGFVSTTHGESEIDATLEAVAGAMEALAARV